MFYKHRMTLPTRKNLSKRHKNSILIKLTIPPSVERKLDKLQRMLLSIRVFVAVFLTCNVILPPTRQPEKTEPYWTEEI